MTRAVAGRRCACKISKILFVGRSISNIFDPVFTSVSRIYGLWMLHKPVEKALLVGCMSSMIRHGDNDCGVGLSMRVDAGWKDFGSGCTDARVIEGSGLARNRVRGSRKCADL